MNPAQALARQALAHGGVAVLVVAALAAADTAAVAAAAPYLAAAWAVVAGLLLSHIIHEWCHFLGARLARSAITLKPAVHPLFFDFDLAANTPRQFLYLAFGGLLGNVLLLAIALVFARPESPVMTAFLAAVAGQFVFVLMLELPVSLGVVAGSDPLRAMTEHFGQGGPLFLRAAVGGVVTAAGIFLLY